MNRENAAVSINIRAVAWKIAGICAAESRRGLSQKFFQGGTSIFCLSLSGCWRCDANGCSQNALSFLYHQENAPCYGNSHKNCASFAQQCFVFTDAFSLLYKSTLLHRNQQPLSRCNTCQDVCAHQSHAAKWYCSKSSLSVLPVISKPCVELVSVVSGNAERSGAVINTQNLWVNCM